MFDTQEIRAGVVPPDTSGSLAMPPVGSGQPVHILDRFNAVFKHRRIAGTAFALVVTSMMVQTYSTIPIYQTSARIEIPGRTQHLGHDDWRQRSDMVAGSAPYYQTQYEILRSRELARRVVRRLNLKENPNFNGHAPHRAIRSRWSGRDARRCRRGHAACSRRRSPRRRRRRRMNRRRKLA